jgi:hypothetical protein
MLHKALRTATVVATAWLVACGGNDAAESTPGQPAGETPTLQAQYEALLLQANEAKAEAEAKASVVCSSNEQCSTLTFRSPLAPCFDTTPLDYSTADSANAAEVEAAAARYATAAGAAEAIAPPSNVSGSCFTNVNLVPLACIDNRCQRGFVFGGAADSGT